LEQCQKHESDKWGDGWTGSHIPHCSDEKRCCVLASSCESILLQFWYRLLNACFFKRIFAKKKSTFLKRWMIEKRNKFREARSFGDRFSRDHVYMFCVYVYIRDV
jgi:hypothetical protein